MSNKTDTALPTTEICIVADAYNRYPGEKVALTVLVNTKWRLTDPTLRVTLSRYIMVDHVGGANHNGHHPYYENGRIDRWVHTLVWGIPGNVAADTQYTYQIDGRIDPNCRDMDLGCEATFISKDGRIIAQSTIEIVVRSKGQYLKYLPAFYEQDDFMGRFLMLFESFRKPIESQIKEMDYYLDPGLAPTELLPWLATWLDLEITEAWAEDRYRELIRWAIALHQKRGTKWALQKHLEIYTGRQAIITEKRLTNFVLGDKAKLDSGVALGPGNSPHTFIVTLYLSPLDIDDEAERVRQEKIRRHTIESIIDMQKPAHTVYVLNLETVTENDRG
ncbi:MAG: hypothetical protein KDJ52_02950 [Anaerolineae bacterium]|nr:hypothetical protein [Anaerolineae bacterium]